MVQKAVLKNPFGIRLLQQSLQKNPLYPPMPNLLTRPLQRENASFLLSFQESVNDASLTQRALEVLLKEVTVIIFPHTKDANYRAQEFHQKGHEILASIDLESEDCPLNDPGPQTILTKLSPQMMEDRLTTLLQKVPYALASPMNGEIYF